MSKRKRRTITFTATPEGVAKAEEALIEEGYLSRSAYASASKLSPNTVDKFFLRKPLKLDSFQKICEELNLDNWKELGEISSGEPLKSLKTQDEEYVETIENANSELNYEVIEVEIDQYSNTYKAVITLRGDLASLKNLAVVPILKREGGESIVVFKIEEGSIKVFIYGSSKDIDRLKSRIESGEIKIIDEFSIENFEIISTKTPEYIDKWSLLEEILNRREKGRKLGGVDLSDTNLNGAYLEYAYLENADLSSASLNGAYLDGAVLSGADLSEVDFTNASLKYTDLYDTNLSHAILKDVDLLSAKLTQANLSHADLSYAKLIGTHLTNIKLSNANLKKARLEFVHLNNSDLSDANLEDANLKGANLEDAYLKNANLKGANLEDAYLKNANVKNARFGNNSGIDQDLKRDLITRGAIFEE